jgi:hypothetical protein
MKKYLKSLDKNDPKIRIFSQKMKKKMEKK